MTKQYPPQITQDHLAKLAMIYSRVSTTQAQESIGSIEPQRNQRAFALAWGWRDEQIEVIEDLGHSSTRSEDRKGFQRVLKLVRGGGVGAIFIADITRVSRVLQDFEALVALCRLHGTLLVIAGQVLEEDTHE